MEFSAASRKKRKDEGRNAKKRKIEEAGGVRPREQAPDSSKSGEQAPDSSKSPASSPSARVVVFKNQPRDAAKRPFHGKHRFGRVMDSVPCRNKPRHSTVSIAIPGSIVANCQTRELKTLLVGQIARAATIYHVDEIVVFDDKLVKEYKPYSGGFRPRDREREEKGGAKEEKAGAEPRTVESEDTPKVWSDPHEFMARLLQYCECPQYLRKHFFPMHRDLQFTGLLAPVDAPHHVRIEDRCKYREGVVLEKKGSNKGSLVNCGIRGRPVEIDACLTPGIRCTVQLDPSSYGKAGQIKGKVVSPSAPREEDGTYWGYTTRLASCLKAALDECPFEGGYDFKVGTSERGTHSIESSNYTVPHFKHCLIVFGGIAGIEECVDSDENIKLPGSESKKLFDHWVNICPYQGSRTIRSEEAVLITLAKYSPLLQAAEEGRKEKSKSQIVQPVPTVNFTDDEPSDESSEEDE